MSENFLVKKYKEKVELLENNSILVNIKNLDKPRLAPASLNPLPTCLIPKFVNLTIGGKANTIVATTPGVRPTPNNITTGIK